MTPFTLVQLASASYNDSKTITTQAAALGFNAGTFLDGEPAGFVAESDTDTVVVFRGSDDVADVIVDMTIVEVRQTDMGRVHDGFQKDLDKYWPTIEARIKAGSKPLWFTGHSMGGALATLAVANCLTNKIPVAGLETFGCPRVGDIGFADKFNELFDNYYRYVYGRDIIPYLPPGFDWWAHPGKKVVLGKVGWSDMVPNIGDHHIINYVNALKD